MLSLNVGIAGAGIAGLSAAITLSKQGHNVTVYESATRLSQIGAGIQITPNASKHLIQWGVDQYLPELKHSVPGIKVRRWQDGNIIARWATETYSEIYGSPYTRIHRADLQTALLMVAKENGAVVNIGNGVVDYDLEQGSMTLKSGQIICPDLVIGADGIRSVLSQKINQNQAKSDVKTGLVIVRATVDATKAEQDNDLAELLQDSAINLWVGPKRHAVAYRVKGDTLLNIVFEFSDDSNPSTWKIGDHKVELQEQFENWDSRLIRMVKIATSTSKWPLQFYEPLSCWTSRSGKLVIIGDASHVVPPSLAQGAAMAIEDAEVLSSILSSIESKNGDEQKERDDHYSTGDKYRPIWNNVKEQSWLYS